MGYSAGDHSTSLGLINAISEKHGEFGILQIDAHMDLREAYEGFEFSHASIMFNALKRIQVSKLVQVGIRDYSEQEYAYSLSLKQRCSVFLDEVLQEESWNGKSWSHQVQDIVAELPQKVYLSFDMDGLEPTLCTKTGTPVPGGLSFNEATFLIQSLADSGREIVGFDVSECGNHVWDANVASRILFRISTCVGLSRGWITRS